MNINFHKLFQHPTEQEMPFFEAPKEKPSLCSRLLSAVKKTCVAFPLYYTATSFAACAPFIATTSCALGSILDRKIENLTKTLGMAAPIQELFKCTLSVGSMRCLIMLWEDIPLQSKPDLQAATLIATGLYAVQRSFFFIHNKLWSS